VAVNARIGGLLHHVRDIASAVMETLIRVLEHSYSQVRLQIPRKASAPFDDLAIIARVGRIKIRKTAA
jgi:hypothetical protein